MTGSLTSLELVVIPLVVILAIVLAALFLYLTRRLRQKRDKLLSELRDSPELIQDRAFNRIAMARREAEIVARSGADVTSARTLIAQAQGAFDTRNYDRAYETAQSAHEALVSARQSTGARPTSPPGRPLSSSQFATSEPTPTAPVVAGTASPPPAPIPKNRVESQFQLRVLGEEIDSARTADAPADKVRTAETLRQQSQTAFNSGDYTEAFRLALRGRRQLGTSLETLPPTGKAPGVPGEALDDSGQSMDAAAAADRVAGANRCPDCGYPMLSADVFCRGCGRPKAGLQCPHCGTPREPKDTFCGRCGERFA